MSNFAFLQAEFPAAHEAARRTEAHAYGDPRVACFYARRALELVVAWLYRRDSALRLPYQEQLAAMLNAPSFQQAAGTVVVNKAVLNAEPAFERLRRQATEIAGLLAEQAVIPTVKQEMALIEAMQGDEWWQDVKVPMLETARRRLRTLIKLIERRARKIVCWSNT